MTTYGFGKWMPDRHAYNDPDIAGEASGVLWGGNSYLPWPQAVAITTAFGGAARGAYLALANDGTVKVFVGTSSKLYRLDSSTPTDVTRLAGGAYVVADSDQWSFAQFRTSSVNWLIACNKADDVQYIDIEAGTNFAALAGSPPKAGYVRTIGNQLFLARLAANTNRVIWSGRGDATYWTVGDRDCDKQDFQDGGEVTGLTTLETGLLFQARAIRRITPVSTRAIFAFNRIEQSRGLIAPFSLVVLGNTAFYYAEEGFFVTDGSGASLRIGVNEVDAWFKTNVNTNRLSAIVGAVDPTSHHIYWLFPSTGSTAEILDHVICYDLMQKAWTHAAISASTIFGAATLGYTVDTLDAFLTSIGLTMDTATAITLDAPWLAGGAQALAIIDSSHKLAFFTGSPMAMTLETADFQPIIGKRAYVRGVTPITDNASAQVQVGTKEAISGTLSYNSAQTVNARGFVAPLRSGRIHRVRVTGAAGDTWSHQRGVEVDAIEDGEI